MPLYFQINNQKVLISSLEDANKCILKVKNPTILPCTNLDISKIAHIDTGEAVAISQAEDKNYPIVASSGTSTCLQANFHSKDQAKCLLHTNDDFDIVWDAIFRNFSETSIDFALIGAAASKEDPSLKPTQNINAFFSSLLEYLGRSENEKLNVTLTHQQILSHNRNTDSEELKKGCSARVPNPGFDAKGNVYDLTPVCSQLKDIPVAPTQSDVKNESKEAELLRNARKHEGEFRAYLCGSFNQRFEKSELLVLTPKTTKKDIESNTSFHKAVIDFAKCLQATNQRDVFCDYMTTLHYGNDVTSDQAKEYKTSLKRFLVQALLYDKQFTSEYSAMATVQGPIRTIVRSYQFSFKDRIEALLTRLLKDNSNVDLNSAMSYSASVSASAGAR